MMNAPALHRREPHTGGFFWSMTSSDEIEQQIVRAYVQLALMEELRGRSMAEYVPEPPIVGGTRQTARPEIAGLLETSLQDFADEVKTLRATTDKLAS